MATCDTTNPEQQMPPSAPPAAATAPAAVDPDPVPPAKPAKDASYTLLDKTRKRMQRYKKYSSASIRDLVSAEVTARTGKVPYSWQLDVVEAILFGLDCIVLAGTGSGKTLPFAMVLLADGTKKKKVIIVSPLNELQKEQVSGWFLFVTVVVHAHTHIPCIGHFLQQDGTKRHGGEWHNMV